MHHTLSFGALALATVASGWFPGMAPHAQAADSLRGPAAPAPAPLAIREQVPAPLPFESLQPIAPPVRLATAASGVVKVIRGQASWYGPGFYGNRTANGELFRKGTLTAAHRTLPFGTRVRVTNLSNGRSTVVRINDRGPFHRSRVIDLAHGAASQVGLTASGLAPVKLEVLR